MASEGGSSVRVAVRIRPLTAIEQLEGVAEVVSAVTGSTQIALLGGGNKDNKNFTFDYTFPRDTDQSTIYDECVASLLEGERGDPFFEGFNATILAYGQTGS
ncbi:unnamed protein product, partial [Phaeothamnion confervicola]